MNMANTTGCKTLDKIGNDPRVQEVYRDREPWSSSYVYTLAPVAGYTCDPLGAHAAVENSVRDISKAYKRLTRCVCAECVTHNDRSTR